MVDKIKKSMRISHSLLDDDIWDNIKTCFCDMKRVGVLVKEVDGEPDESENSELVKKAAELYCKAEYDYLGKGEQFRKNYESLRDAMSMSKGYEDVR